MSEPSTPEHHPAIAACEISPLAQPPEFNVGFLGVRTRYDYERGMDGARLSSDDRIVTPVPPGFNEEYFEWIDLFEAAADAAEEFVMVELGAGYGRWLVRGEAVARRRGLRFRGVAIEAEPDHFRWLRQHCRDNDLSGDDLELIWAAIDAEPGFVPFYAGKADAWYGQAVAGRGSNPLPDVHARRTLRARSILGRPPSMPAEGESIIWVPRVTLPEILGAYPRIDLIDLDVQGLEFSILGSAIDFLDRRVRRLHIGTHSAEAEHGLRTLFSERGWQNLNDYPCQARSATPYGAIDFGDGVQTWVNPALARGDDARELRSPTVATAAPSGTADAALWRARVTALEQQFEAVTRRLEKVTEKNGNLRTKLAQTREEFRGKLARIKGKRPGRETEAAAGEPGQDAMPTSESVPAITPSVPGTQTVKAVLPRAVPEPATSVGTLLPGYLTEHYLHPGARLIAVTPFSIATPTGQWAYALSALPRPEIVAADGTVITGVRLVLDVSVVRGRIGVGWMNAEGNAFVYERFLDARDHHITLSLSEGQRVGRLVFRNGAPSGAHSEFIISSARLQEVTGEHLYPVAVAPRLFNTEPAPDHSGATDVFDTEAALEINKARMGWLESANLDVQGARVLDVGCGIGHFIPFYTRRGCTVVAVDGREENIAELRRRRPEIEAHVADAQELDPHAFGTFDVIHCFGLLYHLDSPVAALRRFHAMCRRMLILETMVCDSSKPVTVLADETKAVSQAMGGLGSRPSPAFVAMALNRLGFKYVYAANQPPLHPDFEFTWQDDLDTARNGVPIRCVFVASHEPLHLPSLVPLLDV